MGKAYVCPFCQNKVDGDEAILHKGRRYHPSCYQEVLIKEELYEYICKLFTLKAPGPKNFALLKKYREENGYTYAGVLNALRYFYEVKRGAIKKADARIGIVPYVYDEAQEYYRRQERKQEVVAKEISEAIESTKTTVKVEVHRKVDKKKALYDLENL
jgi:hypothetical protein